MSDYASQAGHWYRIDGTPCYTITGTNGKERNTTLRDARTMGLVPSTTGIIGCADKPALTQWFVKQAIMASLTLPRESGEADDAYIARILTDSKKEGADARDIGIEIHDAIDRRDVAGEWAPWVTAAYTALTPLWAGAWDSEKSFAYRYGKHGYGGKVDLHAKLGGVVVDVKSKDGPAAGRKLWDDEVMQLAAYREGLGMPGAACAILHVDRNAPTAELLIATEDDLRRGWAMFCGLLQFWYSRSGLRHDPT